jgi:hypothetical protein
MFNKQKYIESEFYYPNDKESDWQSTTKRVS